MPHPRILQNYHPIVGLSSGYWTQSAHVLPKQDKNPWKAGGINYIGDCISLYYTKFNTDNLELTVANKKCS